MTGDEPADDGEQADEQAARPIPTVLREEFPERILVYEVEPAGLWFSGMNANLGPLLDDVAGVLDDEGYTVGDPEDDGYSAAENGGMVLPVEEVGTGDPLPDGGAVGLSSSGVPEFDDADVEAFREAFESRSDEFTHRTPVVRGPRGATDAEVRRRVERSRAEDSLLSGGETVGTKRGRREDGDGLLSRTVRLLRGFLP